jgi:hypothetical protein
LRAHQSSSPPPSSLIVIPSTPVQSFHPFSSDHLILETFFIPFLIHLLKQLILITFAESDNNNNAVVVTEKKSPNQQPVQAIAADENVASSPTTTISMENMLRFFDSPLWWGFVLVQLISIVLVFNLEECSPIVLFSWWRNKIS